MASKMARSDASAKCPQGIKELSDILNDGRTGVFDLMGVVHDHMSPSRTSGTDIMLTLNIRDESYYTGGFRVKYFKKTAEELPQVQQNGDVVLLRKVKVQIFRGELSGLASAMTEHVVFPLTTRGFSKSTKTTDPSPHEQAWARSLREFFAFEIPKSALNPSRTTKVQVVDAPTRDRLSLMKNVIVDRGTSGVFVDLAGEVVKMYFNHQGYLDLYLCDYTINKDLHEYKSGDQEGKGGRCPAGRMTLHIELSQPHASWTHDNVHEGDLIRVDNVRIKYNLKGAGSELEGNLWQDKIYPDKVGVRPLLKDDARAVDIRSRRSSFLAILAQATAGDTKSARKRKRKHEKESKLAVDEVVDDPIAKRSKIRDSGVFMNASDETDADYKDDAGQTGLTDTKRPTDESLPTGAVKSKLNPNVRCAHIDVPFSTLEDIVDDGGRVLVGANGDRHIAPFSNVKHHAKLRVKDFYPHRLRDFTVYEPEASSSSWQWSFWLVLAAPGQLEAGEQAINVLVHGRDAEELLQLTPDDLSRNKQLLQKLEQRLFFLWGELAEQKDKFLRSHPQHQADEDFALEKFNISTQNRSFECCIAEYGIEVPRGEDDDNKDWMRVYKLFGTTIEH